HRRRRGAGAGAAVSSEGLERLGQAGLLFEASPLRGARFTLAGVSSVSRDCQLIARHSARSSQRTHSFIFLRLAMTVPKQSFVIRVTRSPGKKFRPPAPLERGGFPA